LKFIDKQADLDQAMEAVRAHAEIAVDTEADSLHSYFDKVCLIQISVPEQDLIVDPLTNVELKRFGETLADPNVRKVLHGADYDLRILHRDFGFTISNLVDTSICAQLLGYEAFGLAALLERHFGIKLDKSHQRADWAMRPLTPEMLDYAAMDTRYLIQLAGKLREELETVGRWQWAVEEFSRLEQVRFTERDEDEEPFRRLKGIGGFDRRSLAIIRALHGWRDELARAADRPPFKVIGNDALIDIAKNKAASTDALAELKPVSQYHRRRYGRDIVRVVKAALALPEDALPQKSESKPWQRDKELEARVNKHKTVRDRIAKDLKVDTSVLAPRHVLTAIASTGTLDVPAMRNWQRAILGEPLLEALKK
jgi:ribonuclease D